MHAHMQVVQLVSKCGEQSGEAIQLAVLRALLTIATAEHFVVHGDCLMQVKPCAQALRIADMDAAFQLDGAYHNIPRQWRPTPAPAAQRLLQHRQCIHP